MSTEDKIAQASTEDWCERSDEGHAWSYTSHAGQPRIETRTCVLCGYLSVQPVREALARGDLAPGPVGEGAALIAATEQEIADMGDEWIGVTRLAAQRDRWAETARILARALDERPHGCDGLCEQAAEHGMHPPVAEPEVPNWERDLIERQASEPVALGAGDIVFLANVEGPWTVTEWDFSETAGGWPTAYVRLDQRPDAESAERPSGEKPWLSRQVGSLIAGFVKRNLERWLPPHPGGYFGEPALAVLLVVDRLLSEIALKDSLIRAIQPPAAPVQPEERADAADELDEALAGAMSAIEWAANHISWARSCARAALAATPDTGSTT